MSQECDDLTIEAPNHKTQITNNLQFQESSNILDSARVPDSFGV
jgi:hypothetical protein